MIYSKECINPNEGFELQPDGSMKPNKLGYFVKELHELRRWNEDD